MNRHFLHIAALLILFGCATAGQAQVSMTLQVPPGGVLLKKQLWAMALVYTGNTPIYTRVSLLLTDASGSQPLLTAATPSFLLSRGAKQITAADVSPIQYQYLSPAITDRDPEGFLPVGAYQACYTVLAGDEQSSPLAEDCVQFEVEPLSPPMLNTPADEDTLPTTLPQFTWLPPSPLNLFSNLSYRFNLVEVRPGQNPSDALQENLPVYTNRNVTDIYMNYPASALSLDTAKQYAWQVVAQNNLQPAAQSEVWTFRLKGSGQSYPQFNGNYIVLKAAGEGAGAYTVANGVIGIKFYSFDKDRYTDIKFFSADQKLVTVANVRIVNGTNYITYGLGASFKSGQLYFIQIKGMNNIRYTAAFRIK